MGIWRAEGKLLERDTCHFFGSEWEYAELEFNVGSYFFLGYDYHYEGLAGGYVCGRAWESCVVVRAAIIFKWVDLVYRLC